MWILSPVLNHVLYPTLGRVGYFRSASHFSVLTYHGVMPETYHPRDPMLDGHLHKANDLRRELKLLKRHYSVIPPEQFLAWSKGNSELPKRAVLLTCDDGLLNTATDMLPILQEEQLPCLFFVTCDALNNELRMLWYEELYLMLMDSRVSEFQIGLDSVPFKFALNTAAEKQSVWQHLLKKLSHLGMEQRAIVMALARTELRLDDDWESRYFTDPILQRRFAVLSLSHLHQLAQAGMTIGAHTLSHPMLSEQTPEMAQMELSESRRSLEGALGSPVWALAYPFGTLDAVGEREFRMAESAGYQCAFVSSGGALRKNSCRFALPRVHIPGDIRIASFEAYASGFHSAFRTRIRTLGAQSSTR